MKVTIIAHTPEPEKVVAASARLCYSKTSASNIMNNLTNDKANAFLKKLTQMGHMSPTEHISFTFAIDGVSRTLLAQLTRHRIASYSVQSLRYNNPFKSEILSGNKDIQEKNLSKENTYYMEGLVYANNLCKDELFTCDTPTEKCSITGKSPEQINKNYLTSYLRGIYDACGCCHKNKELVVSFPKKIESVIKLFYSNTTFVEEKILIKKEEAEDFLLFIYDKLDYINSYYNQEKLLEICKQSTKFYKVFLGNVKDYIETVYYSMMPESIAQYPEAILPYIKGLESCKNTYVKLVKLGIDQEDARYILPMSTQTRVVMTMNARSLQNFFALRCCKRAQTEIRELANLMLEEVKKIAPAIFEHAGPPCESNGICPEGELSCGKYPTS
jgi:thymidylate synthase (FAD)